MRKISLKLVNYYFYKITSKLFLNKDKNLLKFTKIYILNSWGNNESVSGPSSTINATKNFRKKLPLIFKKFKIKSILDAPCGDFNWMNHFLKEKNIKYLGGDIVYQIIKKNNYLYKKTNISFKQMDIIKDKLPKNDLMVCRDCLIHFSNKDIFKFLINFYNSPIKYLLTTSYLKYKNGKSQNFENKDIATGEFRVIDLFSKPFNFSKKILLKIDDNDAKFSGALGKIFKKKAYLFTKEDIEKMLRKNNKL